MVGINSIFSCGLQWTLKNTQHIYTKSLYLLSWKKKKTYEEGRTIENKMYSGSILREEKQKQAVTSNEIIFCSLGASALTLA